MKAELDEPKIIKIDPRLIQFNKNNHRQHHGAKFTRLRENVENVGMVQLPSVRIVGANRYECLDGEGRIRSEIENGKSHIFVVSFGVVDDDQALKMLEAANIARDYNLLAVCIGLAKLRESGMSTKDIKEQYVDQQVNKGALDDMIAIGSFPQDILESIEADISSGNEATWTFRLLRNTLPLRIETGREEKSRGKGGPARKIYYNYDEVRKAIQLVLDGEIQTSIKMKEYAIDRKADLLESRLSTIIKERMQVEREEVERELTKGKENAFAQKEQEYQTNLKDLDTKYQDLMSKYNSLLHNVTTRPEILKKQEEELRKQIEETAEIKREVIATRKRIEEQASQTVQSLLESERVQLNESFEKRREQLEEQYSNQLQQVEEELRSKLSDFERKDAARQIEAENSIRQTVLHTSGTLTQSQKALALLFSQSYKKGLPWLHSSELSMLYSQLDALSILVENGKDTLRSIAEQDHVITIESGENTHA